MQYSKLRPPRSPRRRARAWSPDVEPNRLGGFQVDDQLELGRRLHRQVGGLLALEDAIDIAGRAAVLVYVIRPVGDQAASGDKGAVGVNGRQFVQRRVGGLSSRPA